MNPIFELSKYDNTSHGIVIMIDWECVFDSMTDSRVTYYHPTAPSPNPQNPYLLLVHVYSRESPYFRERRLQTGRPHGKVSKIMILKWFKFVPIAIGISIGIPIQMNQLERWINYDKVLKEINKDASTFAPHWKRPLKEPSLR